MSAVLPHQNGLLVGHEEALREIGAAFASSRMHHAWLIAGIDGIGKATLAYHIAHHVLSGGENKLGKLDMNHRVAKLVAAEAHPDMLVVRRAVDEKTGEFKTGIDVKDARNIATFLHKTSTHGGWRVVIVDEAHLLNRHGQNGILKILEEPPSRVLILMTVTTPGVLLPTIRSRCRVMQLAPLSDQQMKTVLARAAPDVTPEAIDRLVGLSAGSVGFALTVLRTDTLPLHEEMLAILKYLPKLDLPRLHKLTDQINRKADLESFDVLRTLLIEHLRQAARTAADQQGAVALDQKLQVWDRVRDTFATADVANLDRKLAFIKAITEIRNAA